MATTARDDAGGSVIGFAIVFVSFVFRGFIPAPFWVWLVVLAAGILFAVKDGISGLDLITLGLAGVMIVGPLLVDAATPNPPDLEEPIPVPTGYGFELDPDSTNLEHLYESGSMTPKRAEFAAVEVVDHYVNGLTPEWTVVDRQETPELLSATLREGDSSRGIGISVYVVKRMGRPTFLDLRIQARYCTDDLPGQTDEVSCMTAPISDIVRYPGGEPVVPSPQPSPGPLREPVPVPSGYGFFLDTGLSKEDMHAYRSTIMSIPEARRARHLVMRYYRQALDGWVIVENAERILVVRDPDSMDGLAIQADWSVWDGEDRTGVLGLSIKAISCQEKDYCGNWLAVGA